MKIIRLEAENFKRLKAIDITPAGNVVQITGRNAQGKSSILDAIWGALCGAAHIQAQPIRKGATKARIRLDLGDIVVTRSITEKGSTLTVENAEGMAYKSPQRMLDDLVGALAFDPLAFTRMKAREQFDQLRTIAKVDLDLDAIDAQNKRDFEKRTELNRDARALRSQLEGIPDPGPQPEAADLSALLEKQQRLNSSHADAVLAQQKRQSQEQDLDRLHREIEEIRAAFQAKKQAIELVERELEGMAQGDSDRIQDLSTQILDVNSQIREAREANEAAAEGKRNAERRKDLEDRAKTHETRAQELTESMEIRTKTKQDAIARAKVPVAGLGFGEGVVLYNEVPFEQASSAEQLRVSVAIAMAANPKLRVIRIQDGSLLDDTSLQVIADMARENDMQVWIESVANSNTVGIVIEDGAVLVNNYNAGTPAAPGAQFPASHRGPESIGVARTALESRALLNLE